MFGFFFGFGDFWQGANGVAGGIGGGGVGGLRVGERENKNNYEGDKNNSNEDKEWLGELFELLH